MISKRFSGERWLAPSAIAGKLLLQRAPRERCDLPIAGAIPAHSHNCSHDVLIITLRSTRAEI